MVEEFGTTLKRVQRRQGGRRTLCHDGKENINSFWMGTCVLAEYWVASVVHSFVNV